MCSTSLPVTKDGQCASGGYSLRPANSNKEVICKSELGIMEPFGDYEKLLNAVDQALKEYWDKQNIIEYA